MPVARVEIQRTNRFSVFAVPGTSCAVRWPQLIKRKTIQTSPTADSHKKPKPSPIEPYPSSTTTRDLPHATQTDGERALADSEPVVQVRLARALYQEVVGGMPSARLTAAKTTLPSTPFHPKRCATFLSSFVESFAYGRHREPPR